MQAAESVDVSHPLIDLESQYVVDTWQTDQGLADDFINRVAQSPDGYLWVLTFNGLSRFNGIEFVTFDAANTPELPSSRMTEHYLDRDGRLWLRSESGSWCYWWKGQFKRMGPAQGLPDAAEHFRLDAQGNVNISPSWDGTNFFRLVGDHFVAVADHQSFRQRFGVASDNSGRCWTIESNRMCCLDPANPCETPVPHFDGRGWRLLASRDGGMWVIANHILKFREGQWLDFGSLPVATDFFTERLEDRDGNLWVGTEIGELWRVTTNGVIQRLRLPGNTSAQLGRGLMEDAEGDIWVGTGGAGLFRLKPKLFRVYGRREGLASEVVRSVTQDREGNVWLAAVDRVDWIKPTDLERVQPRGIDVKLPWEVLGGRDGSVWIGTYTDGLLHQQGSEGTWLKIPNIHPPINVVFEEERGNIDLGTPRGLYTTSNGCLVKIEGPVGISRMDVRAIAQDAKGSLYIGLENQGLLRKSGSRWDRFAAKDGLPDDHLRALWMDADDSLWIGTETGGLCRFKSGRFFNFHKGSTAAVDFDLPNTISSIIGDAHDFIWFGSNRGLFRAPRKQLNDFADGHSTSVDVVYYDRSDGMGSSQCIGDHQPACWKASDGKLWFATMKGVAVVDPKSLGQNSRPPPVVIEGIYLNDSARSLPLEQSKDVTIPAGIHRLEFRYAALSFSAPKKVRYRYRLKGFDVDWVNAGNRRSAYYTKAPPGPYRFEVIAANSDNVWSETGAFVDVRIQPLFWQTTWFRIAALLSLVGMAASAYQLRVRGLHVQRALQETFSRRLIESQENERKRMAAELHDSLGQNLLVLNNHAALALKEFQNQSKTEERLRKISQGASSCIEEVRAVARSLRPYQLDRFGLSKTLEDIGELLSTTAGLRVSTAVQNVDGLLSSESEIGVYRIAQEWLSNVIKHARATEAKLKVTCDSGWVRLILEDNGVGFDYAAVMTRAGGQRSFGLLNLRERARLLGGSAEIETAPGRGTSLIVSIPYGKATNRIDRG